LVNYFPVEFIRWIFISGVLVEVPFRLFRVYFWELCIYIGSGSGCIDDCFKGIYKAYVLNCHFVNAVKLKHIRFLSNCVIELLGVDLPTAYQHAFTFIGQLAMILRDALDTKTKVLFINILNLWNCPCCLYLDFK
jgi:nucleolar complex protein 2